MSAHSIAHQAAHDSATVIEHLFNHDHWHMSREIIRSAMQPNSRTAVKKCHASSGTFTAADIALYSLVVGGDVIATAPTWTQVEQVLFPQAHAALRDSLIPFQEWGAVNKTEIRLPTGEVFRGLSTDVGVRFQGHHARPGSFLLIIFDEAPGVREDIYEAVQGISAGGDVRLLMLGNPVVRSGAFFDIFADRTPGWNCFTIDAFDTPNFADEEHPGQQLTLEQLLALPESRLTYAPRPYLVTRRWVLERYHEWSEDSPIWQSRVRGDFPDDIANGVVPLSFVRACQRLDREYAPAQLLPVELGVDVGAGGDETVIRERRGMVAGRTWRYHTPNSTEAAGYVRQAIDETGATRVKIDVIGIGWGVVGTLVEQHARREHGAEIVGVNVGAASTEPERFPKLRDQLWWEVGRELSRQLAWDLSAIDETTVAQLIAPTWKPDSSGRHQIEKKADTRKRLKRSPDDADALLLAFYAPLVVDFQPAAGGDRPALGDMRHTGAPVGPQQPVRPSGIPGTGMRFPGGAGRLRGY